ncbi:enoyl-CoA hydratase/isomerase family protein [Nocardia sp. NBC_00416]|uniref:enoyl-CoA hydratase/isomerase family protein n=1 Tax=Nocardia sp. NBC_00416 TaxID=2975991 RepID=UPI002E24A6FB
MPIDIEDNGPVRRITLNRPEALNALDPQSMIDLRRALIAFNDDDTALVAILTGAGTRAFCAGADLKNTAVPDTPFASSYYASFDAGMTQGAYVRALVWTDLSITKPIVAAINGHALGGGLEIALQCDVRIASTNATFGLPESRWASVPGAGGVSNLLHAIPSAVAMKMALTGERIDAARAEQLGLISDVVEPDQLTERAEQIAEQIAANGPIAVRAITTMARRAANIPLNQSIELEQMLWGLLRDTEDRIEGRAAFADKRPPAYRGR